MIGLKVIWLAWWTNALNAGCTKYLNTFGDKKRNEDNQRFIASVMLLYVSLWVYLPNLPLFVAYQSISSLVQRHKGSKWSLRKTYPNKNHSKKGNKVLAHRSNTVTRVTCVQRRALTQIGFTYKFCLHCHFSFLDF